MEKKRWEVQILNTTCSEHFWKLRRWKRKRRFGAKHASKSKCQKHLKLGPLFGGWVVKKVHAVVAHFKTQMYQSLHVGITCGGWVVSKKCTLFWSEARFEVIMTNAPHVWTTCRGWEIEKVHAVVVGSTFEGLVPPLDVEMSTLYYTTTTAANTKKTHDDYN